MSATTPGSAASGTTSSTSSSLTPASIDLIDNGDGAAAFQGVGNAVGDVIDVSGIDAASGAGNQTFIFNGAAAAAIDVVNLGNGMSQVRGNTDAAAASSSSSTSTMAA